VLFKGLFVDLAYFWDVPGVTKKSGRYPLARQILLPLGAVNAGFGHPAD
jgi:hypothetical protein